jgi:hypothetical protein
MLLHGHRINAIFSLLKILLCGEKVIYHLTWFLSCDYGALAFTVTASVKSSTGVYPKFSLESL